MLTDVFFDFFGTLVDYDPSVHPAAHNAPHAFASRAQLAITAAAADAHWRDAWATRRRAARASGHECTMHDIAGTFAERIGAPGDPAELDRLVTEYLDAWTEHVTLRDGIRELLDALAGSYQLSVVSNTHHRDLVPRMLRRFDLDGDFAHVVTSVEVGWRKPHPRIYEHALHVAGARPEQVAFIGDSWDADVVGPRTAGMHARYVGKAGPAREPMAIAAIPAWLRAVSPDAAVEGE